MYVITRYSNILYALDLAGLGRPARSTAKLAALSHERCSQPSGRVRWHHVTKAAQGLRRIPVDRLHLHHSPC
jgi:hypothetical protein